MSWRKRDGQQLHARLLWRPARLMVVTTLTGSHDIVPDVLPLMADWCDMIPGQQFVPKLIATVQANLCISLEQGRVI